MVCDAGELEAARGRACWPTSDDVADSLTRVDVWGTRHTFYPYLITVVTGDPFAGVAVACVYESIGVINSIYDGPFTWLEYPTLFVGSGLHTTVTDTTLQDPGYALVGSLCAWALTSAYAHRGVTWRGFVKHVLTCLPFDLPQRWLWAARWLCNLLFIGMFRWSFEMTRWWDKDTKGLWGSSNHLFLVFVPLLLACMWAAGCHDRDMAAFALVLLWGPVAVLNVVGALVWHGCDHWYTKTLVSCSTFMWSGVGLAVYTAVAAGVALCAPGAGTAKYTRVVGDGNRQV